MLDSCKMVGPKAVWSIPYVSLAFLPSLKQNFIAYRSSKVSSRPDCIFEIPLLLQSVFNRVYSNCCCSCSFKPEIIKIGQSSQKMYNNNILNSQESTTILNACTKKKGLETCCVWTPWRSGKGAGLWHWSKRVWTFVAQLQRVGQTSWLVGCIIGLWIIKGRNLLKSKEFSLDSSSNVYFLFLEAPSGRTKQSSRQQFAHFCPTTFHFGLKPLEKVLNTLILPQSMGKIV